MIILTIMLVQVLYCHLITKITRNGINGAMFVTLVYVLLMFVLYKYGTVCTLRRMLGELF